MTKYMCVLMLLAGCSHATTVEGTGRPYGLNCPAGYYSPDGKACVWEDPTTPEPCHADGGVVVGDSGRPPKCPYGGSWPYCYEPAKP